MPTHFLRPACLSAVFGAAVALAGPAAGQSAPEGMGMSMAGDGHGGMSMDMDMMRADRHAPIGVMGGNMMMAGKWMVSYRYMRMEMSGNRIGTDEVSPEEIATTVPNRFAGAPGQPPTLRVVPTDMTTQMHMFGAMYAPTNWLTLMGMASYVDKSMDHVTFQGPSGTDELGEFTTESEGVSDTKLSGLIRLFDEGPHHAHLNAGISLPTGSIKEKDSILTPLNTTPTVRLPYPMQIGSGTFDLLPGITYTGRTGDIGWGAQYQGTIRLGENNENYALGNEHQVTAWGSYAWARWISTSFRATGRTIGEIDGIDPNIVGPVQTANPDFQGGERLDLALGLNLAGQHGPLKGARFGVEVSAPVVQDLNGPQMEGDWMITAGLKYMF